MRTAAEARARLEEGNARFVADKNNKELADSARRATLTDGQAPYAIVLSCADSRVVPEMAFDVGLGEIFTVRVAGNVANTSSIASIEYAVAHLKTPIIVVLGHEACGAVTAAVNGGDNGHNLNHLLAHITPAVEVAKGEPINEVVKVNARQNVDALIERSQIIRDAAKSGRLKVVPAYYELGSGRVSFLD